MMGRGQKGAESLSETPPQIKWRVKTPLSLSEMMGRGRNGGGASLMDHRVTGRGWGGVKPTLK